MSHSNEQCAADLRDAWQEGYADAIAVLPQVTVILQDLIAELRTNYAGGRMLELADRAEARLREANQ